MYKRALGIALATLAAAAICSGPSGSTPILGQDAGSHGATSLIGRHIANFQLKDTDGKLHRLEDLNDSQLVVVLFVGRECPLVRLYVPRLKELQQQFAGRSISWLAINSNQHDSLTELQHFARTQELTFPLLKDPGNVVADQFGATRTPEVFVLDRQRHVRYHGRIDDQYTYGRVRPAVTTPFVANALDDLLAGNEVAVAETEPEGCIIGRVLTSSASVGPSDITYSKHISRVLQNHCVSCHRAGEIGPFELNDYSEVVGWAGMIREVVNQRRMPPWHANPDHGSFRNDCRLTEDEIDMINRWVDSGAPEGDPADLPEPRQFASGWQIGQPDLVVPMSKRPYRVPATGTVEYEYFEVDPGFREDKWVKAAECRPGNRAVIHHIIVGVAGEGEFGGRGVHDRVQSDWIAATAPGSPPMILPEGYAKFVPAGSKLIFQMHYTPNGTATTDISSVGLVFAEPDEVTHQVATLKALNEDFRIPPGAGNHEVKARFRFRRAAELLTLFPHMHLRGKSFRYTAIYPDGEQEILLDVPAYDFNWQNAYELIEPKQMPRGTRLHCVAHFDNSENNLANPDPTTWVRWGDQTWEEMMIGYFNVALPVER